MNGTRRMLFKKRNETASFAMILLCSTLGYLAAADLPAACARAAEATAPFSPEKADAGMVGVVVAHKVVDLTSEVQGRLEAIHVEMGDRVAREDILAELDTWSVERDLEMAQAALQSALAGEHRAALEYDQAREIFGRRNAVPDAWSVEELASTRATMEMKAASLDVSRASTIREQAAVEKLQETLAAMVIRAPFDGMVAERYQDPGAMVYSGTPVVKLISNDELWVRFAVPEDQAGGVAPGMMVTVEVPAVVATAVAGTAAEGQVTGSVAHIAPEIDPASQTLTVEAVLTIPDGLRHQVRSGMTARVRFVASAPEQD